MKYALLSLLFLFLWNQVPAQKNPWASLLTHPDSLRAHPEQVEPILALVKAATTDSVVPNKKMHHITPIGWLAQALGGLGWRKIADTKQTLVGTSQRELHIFRGIGKEWDINLFVVPHEEPFISMVRQGFDTAISTGRSTKQWRQFPGPIPCPEPLARPCMECLTIECETTPAWGARTVLDSLLLPLATGDHPLQDHPHFGTALPAFGMTGVWCLDCNHGCRPEIHPIDWLWWMNLEPTTMEGPGMREWYVALLRDNSKRFYRWSPSPMTGSISIPFCLPKNHTHLNITLEVSVSDAMGQKRTPGLSLKPGIQSLELEPEGGVPAIGTATLTASGLCEDLEGRISLGPRDPQTGNAFGYLHLSTSVANVLALKINFRTEP